MYLMETLEKIVLVKIRQRQPATPREIARLLAARGYREVLRVIHVLIEVGTVRLERVKYKKVLFVNNNNEEAKSISHGR